MVAPAPAPTPIPTPDPAPTVWSAFLDTLRELADSKKAMVLVSTIIAWIALKLGWHVDQTQIDRLLAVASAYLLGQGIADHGKGRAEVEAKMQARLGTLNGANDNRTAIARTGSGGFIRTRVMLVLAFLGAIGATTMTGCPHAGQVVLATGQCVLDSGVLGTILADLISAKYAVLVADAVTKFGPQLVTCALQAIAASQPPSAGSGAGSSAGSGTMLRGPYDPVVVARAKEMLVKYGAAK